MSLMELEKKWAEQQRRLLREMEGFSGRLTSEALAASSLLNFRNTAAEAARQSLLHSAIGSAARIAQTHQNMLSSFRAAQSEAFKDIFGGFNRSAAKAIAEAVASVNSLAANTGVGIAAAALGAASHSSGFGKAVADTATRLATTFHNDKALAGIGAWGTLSFSNAFAETAQEAARAIAEAHKVNLGMLGAIAGSGGLAALDFSGLRADLSHLSALRTSFAGQLADLLREELASEEPGRAESSPVEDLISRKVAFLPQDKVVAEGLLNLYIAILSMIITLSGLGLNFKQYLDSGKASEKQEQLFARLLVLTEKVAENTGQLKPSQDTNTYYVVHRKVELRLRSKSTSPAVAILFPNQRVKLVQKSHQWIYVEYFDEIEAVPKYGWAYKKYFKRLTTDYSRGWVSRNQPMTVGLKESLSPAERVAITSDWEQTNARRVELIRKKVKSSITPDEGRELENLQRLADERIRLLAPLPIKNLESLLENIKAEDK